MNKQRTKILIEMLQRESGKKVILREALELLDRKDDHVLKDDDNMYAVNFRSAGSTVETLNRVFGIDLSVKNIQQYMNNANSFDMVIARGKFKSDIEEIEGKYDLSKTIIRIKHTGMLNGITNLYDANDRKVDTSTARQYFDIYNEYIG